MDQTLKELFTAIESNNITRIKQIRKKSESFKDLLQKTDENGNSLYFLPFFLIQIQIAPLHIAILNNVDKEIIIYLVERGADVHQENSKKQTPIELATPRIRGMIKATIEIMTKKEEILNEQMKSPNLSNKLNNSKLSTSETMSMDEPENSFKSKMREDSKKLLEILADDSDEEKEFDKSMVVYE